MPPASSGPASTVPIPGTSPEQPAVARAADASKQARRRIAGGHEQAPRQPERREMLSTAVDMGGGDGPTRLGMPPTLSRSEVGRMVRAQQGAPMLGDTLR